MIKLPLFTRIREGLHFRDLASGIEDPRKGRRGEWRSWTVRRYTDQHERSHPPSARRAVILALALYLLWVLATYLLEGRILTLQRPEATGARLAYALVANILVGIGGSVLVVRVLSNWGEISARRAGFRGLRHATVAVAVGVVLGFAVYAITGRLVRMNL